MPTEGMSTVLKGRLQKAEKMLGAFLSGEIINSYLYCVHYGNPDAPCSILWNEDKDWCHKNAKWNRKIYED